jgi:alpha/beta superfamily hydrolase
MPEVIINGPDGRIEGRYHHGRDPLAPIALIFHPHPEYGGSMNNKVTYALYRTLFKKGLIL